MHHPNKRVQRTKAPRWDGSEIGGTRGPQLFKDYWGRMPTNYWLRRAACRLRKETTGSAEPPANYNYSQAEGPEDRERRIVVLQPFGKRCTGQQVQQSRRKEAGGRQPTPPAGGTKRSNADLQK